jgi:hypothetical protein
MKKTKHLPSLLSEETKEKEEKEFQEGCQDGD